MLIHLLDHVDIPLTDSTTCSNDLLPPGVSCLDGSHTVAICIRDTIGLARVVHHTPQVIGQGEGRRASDLLEPQLFIRLDVVPEDGDIPDKCTALFVLKPDIPVHTRAFPEVWWTFKTFISKLHKSSFRIRD